MFLPSLMGFDKAGFGDPDALAFFARVTAAGGSLTTTEKAAVTTLVTDLKGYGIWTAMKAIYPMVGASAAACAQNLKSSSFTGTFTSGWTFASTGVTPNGTSAYMDTNLQMQQISNTTNHISAYTRSAIGNDKSIIGVFDGGRYTILGTGSTFTYYCAYNSLFVTQNVITKTGFLFGTYISGIEKLYRNGTEVASNGMVTTPSTSTRQFYLGCYNNNGSTLQFINNEIAFGSLGDGLTSTQASNFYTAVQAFQTTLSRNV